MALGLALFLFLLVLLLVSISPLREWRLDDDTPLDDDDLPWAAAGYGSAAVSLDCLFSAYSASLILIGYTCFGGIILGFITGLFALNLWMTRFPQNEGFQAILYHLRLFTSPANDKLFWFLAVFCQFGLALTELVLLHHVFSIGLGFSVPHATAACLSVAIVAYFYILIGGYRSVFRSDAIQFVFVVVMGGQMLALLGRPYVDSPGLLTMLPEPPMPWIVKAYPLLRRTLELLAGFALGLMPILAAPDAWKRVIVILRRRAREDSQQTPITLFRRMNRAAPVRLLLATAIPLALITPLLLKLAEQNRIHSWTFPLHTLFAIAPHAARTFIVLGMVAAFMSTFNSALLAGTHLLLKQRTLTHISSVSELKRFRLILAVAFTVLALLLIPLVAETPHPYAIGAFMIGPYAIVSGSLAGTRFGQRRLSGSPIIYVLLTACALWIFTFIRYCARPDARTDPYAAAPVVGLGTLVFYFVVMTTWWLSHEERTTLGRVGGADAD